MQELDQYGRLLVYVWIGGKSYNERLLEQGLAQVVVYPPNLKYVDPFRAVQKKAQVVQHNLAKVGVVSSSLVVRSIHAYLPRKSLGKQRRTLTHLG